MNSHGYRDSTPNDICVNCGCPRWRHKLITYYYKKKIKKLGHCTKCGSLKCKQFRRHRNDQRPNNRINEINV